MRRHIGILVLPVLAALAAGCGAIKPINAPDSGVVSGGSADFSRYVSMGTSIAAGTQSSGLQVTHQQKSYAYLFSRQIGATTWPIPSVSVPGIPALLRIKGVTPLGGVIINNTGIPNGVETNRAQATAYSNMGVPFAVLPDVADASRYYLGGGDRATSFDIVVRHRGTILQEVASLAPTFITFEYGSNEILGSATNGQGAPLVPAVQWAGALNQTLNGLQALVPGAKLALFTVPDPTTTPHMTTFKPYALDTLGHLVALIGPSGPMSPGDLVPLGAGTRLAQGYGFPTNTRSYVSGVLGNGLPLGDSLVLSVGETASIRVAVDAYNVAVRSEAAARHAALVDMGGLLKTLAANGYRYQTQLLTTAFVTGGLFSLDGVHPTDIAQGILCNALIDAVNLQFGANVPHVDLGSVASASSSRALPAGTEAGTMPWVEDSHGFSGAYFPWR